MRKLKMFGLALAAAALVFMITVGQWKSDISKTAWIVSDWLVRGTASIRDSETAHFVASWVAKETDSIRDSYPTRLVTGRVVSGIDALQNVLTSTHPRTSTHPWTDASTSHQELPSLAQESRPAESILPAQPETAAEIRVEEASAPPAVVLAPEEIHTEEVSAAPAVAPVSEETHLEEASAPPAVVLAPEEILKDEASAPPAVVLALEEILKDEASAPVAPPTAPRRGLRSNEVAAYMALARRKIQQGDIAAARRLLERASDSDKAEAWFALAETYDPKMLAQWGVLGVKPDREKAKILYGKAKTLGDQGARERLLAIAN
jgi:hypothetical protein